MNILLITKVKILCEHVGPPIILAIELRVVTIIWARNPQFSIKQKHSRKMIIGPPLREFCGAEARRRYLDPHKHAWIE